MQVIMWRRHMNLLCLQIHTRKTTTTTTKMNMAPDPLLTIAPLEEPMRLPRKATIPTHTIAIPPTRQEGTLTVETRVYLQGHHTEMVLLRRRIRP